MEFFARGRSITWSIRSMHEPDLFRQAAIALHIVANRHPFLDGNKRSAFQIAELILSSEGYAITAKEEGII